MLCGVLLCKSNIGWHHDSLCMQLVCRCTMSRKSVNGKSQGRHISIFCTHRGSLRRLGLDQLALGQLHWSVAKYAPALERALWDGLAAIYDEVQYVCFQTWI